MVKLNLKNIKYQVGSAGKEGSDEHKYNTMHIHKVEDSKVSTTKYITY